MITRVVTHYAKDDPKFLGDHVGIQIFVDDELAAEYGDNYHDEGSPKMSGFIDGVQAVRGDVDVTFKEIADGTTVRSCLLRSPYPIAEHEAE